jgi:hypothetical protein
VAVEGAVGDGQLPAGQATQQLLHVRVAQPDDGAS